MILSVFLWFVIMEDIRKEIVKNKAAKLDSQSTLAAFINKSGDDQIELGHFFFLYTFTC